ncbi:DoxX family protein [Thioalkalivibrio sp. ALE19]|uniref:HvfX family Cu-binding RiPP maturation protein n=1 Tax=Thioalkalivibrio sp. ALE19 TaxID=1266909 RepID=UPI0004092DA9|nr:DoxX family protein [Thioalkalivibrio sp. ALE19]
METIRTLALGAQRALDTTRGADFLAPLLLRLYLAPVFWMAGTNKLDGLLPSEQVVMWFGNPDWGLGMPFPYLMVLLSAYAEILGAIALLLGLATRWATIPLMITMVVAAVTAHLEHGWQRISDPMMCLFNCDGIAEAQQRLDRAKSILQEHGNYDWLTEAGNFAIVNNGIEMAATYFVMLLALFFIGAGRYLSLDHYIRRRFMHRG